ncbi:hypothetical protein BN874_850048 [Candidatus Contendobacter odensis Run_B_J11]|uniref:Uncharacterized protein n=1 Tax=Candidatus Contendobacter odensis Run_B_J11 TaxID=1400861 RepID=A0A7U7GGG9_9GAMM|nr:hypothetical protein BN874_850048 [Candidatus Contendobacter odensis Run_B_J11]
MLSADAYGWLWTVAELKALKNPHLAGLKTCNETLRT